eukprot:Opistho-1_new@33791
MTAVICFMGVSPVRGLGMSDCDSLCPRVSPPFVHCGTDCTGTPMPLPQHVPITVAYRGGHPENIHHGSVAVVNAGGELLASVGDVASPLFTRSALKPFQAMPLIAQAADRYALSDPMYSALI